MKSAVVREAISLVFALKEFETMIRNHDQPVFVLTDASSLIFITKNKNVQSKFYSYALFVSSFKNVSIVHCSSKNMYLADLLFRCFLDFILVQKDGEQSRIWERLHPALPDYKSLKVISPSVLRFFLLDWRKRDVGCL